MLMTFFPADGDPTTHAVDAHPSIASLELMIGGPVVKAAVLYDGRLATLVHGLGGQGAQPPNWRANALFAGQSAPSLAGNVVLLHETPLPTSGEHTSAPDNDPPARGR